MIQAEFNCMAACNIKWCFLGMDCVKGLVGIRFRGVGMWNITLSVTALDGNQRISTLFVEISLNEHDLLLVDMFNACHF